MSLNFTNIIPFIIIVQSTLFAIVLFTNKGTKRVSNYLLATFLLLLAIQFGFIFIRDVYVIDKLNDVMNVFGFGYGPILYLYSRSLIYSDFQFKWKDLTHFAPSTITLGFLIFGFSFRPHMQNIMYVFIVSYMGYSIYRIFQYRKVLKDTRATNQEADLEWLQWILLMFAVIICFDIFEYLLFDIKIVLGVTLVHILVLIMVNWIFYKGLKQPQIFQGISARDESLSSETKNTQIEEVTRDEIDKILLYMDNEKPYTDIGISLSDLAENLDMSDRRLSQVVNSHFDKNFMTFINDYRIDLAKERFKNPLDPKETILEVMYEVGFNSKSSFNALFKQDTGLTPSQYKKQHS